MISHEGRESIRSEQVGGYELRVYEYPESVRIYFAALPDRVILATSRAVVMEAIKAVDGSSVLDDEAFAKALGSGAADDATKIVCVHAARMLEIAAPMMRLHPGEAQQITAMLQDKTATIVTRESPSRVQLSVVVGLENLSEFVRQLLNGEFVQRQEHRMDYRLSERARGTADFSTTEAESATARP